MKTFYTENAYLMHHGIKGQRWGVRRWQNEDGSLTPEGEKRYNKNEAKADRIVAKALNKSSDAKTMKYLQKKLRKVGTRSDMVKLATGFHDEGKSQTGKAAAIYNSVYESKGKDFADNMRAGAYKVSRKGNLETLGKSTVAGIFGGVLAGYGLKALSKTALGKKVNLGEGVSIRKAAAIGGAIGVGVGALNNVTRATRTAYSTNRAVKKQKKRNDASAAQVGAYQAELARIMATQHSGIVYTEGAYLMHSRTPGSKNGVQRYQFSDGTYTELGKARRRKGGELYRKVPNGSGADEVSGKFSYKLGSKQQTRSEDVTKLLTEANNAINALKSNSGSAPRTSTSAPASKPADSPAKTAMADKQAKAVAQAEEKARQKQFEEMAKLPQNISNVVRPMALKAVQKKNAKINAQNRALAAATASKMSDKELRDIVNRINLEEQFINKTSPVVKRGEQTVNDIFEIVTAAGGLAVTALTIASLAKGLKKKE